MRALIDFRPWLDPPALVRLHCLGEHAVIERLLGTATLAERVCARDHWIRHAGVLLGGQPRRTASQLHTRMRSLARRSRATLEVTPIDVASVDGALLAALLVEGWVCPHRTTVCRALGSARA